MAPLFSRTTTTTARTASPTTGCPSDRTPREHPPKPHPNKRNPLAPPSPKGRAHSRRTRRQLPSSDPSTRSSLSLCIANLSWTSTRARDFRLSQLRRPSFGPLNKRSSSHT
eukprot:Amastigsp_a848068_11.p3 type:complete len:111 gc:universal Amastigsp_a848068_11:1023-1355(+)